MVTLNLPNASAMSVTGSRALGDGLMSEFQHITIVVDTAKVIALEMGSLADYIAMLALSQPQNFDTCQDLPSITNLLVTPACSAENTSAAMSVHDLSYLDGLYKMNIAGTVHTQRSEIGYQMKQTQEGNDNAPRDFSMRPAAGIARSGADRSERPADGRRRSRGSGVPPPHADPQPAPAGTQGLQEERAMGAISRRRHDGVGGWHPRHPRQEHAELPRPGWRRRQRRQHLHGAEHGQRRL